MFYCFTIRRTSELERSVNRVKKQYIEVLTESLFKSKCMCINDCWFENMNGRAHRGSTEQIKPKFRTA